MATTTDYAGLPGFSFSFPFPFLVTFPFPFLPPGLLFSPFAGGFTSSPGCPVSPLPSSRFRFTPRLPGLELVGLAASGSSSSDPMIASVGPAQVRIRRTFARSGYLFASCSRCSFSCFSFSCFAFSCSALLVSSDAVLASVCSTHLSSSQAYSCPSAVQK